MVGKSKVVIAVENKGDRTGYVKMSLVNRVSGEEILKTMWKNLDLDTRLRSDGWCFYGILGKKIKAHEKIVVGKGSQASKLLPWVHTMIENVKGILRGVHHGISSKHSGKYLAEFCYKTNRRFWESQLFNRLLHACLNTTTMTFAELRV
ncbi:MAG: IS1595 family transposase [Thermodesulforhabdaceae bacterium]